MKSGSDLGQVDLEKKSVLHLLPDYSRDAQHTAFLLQKGSFRLLTVYCFFFFFFRNCFHFEVI